MPRNYNIKESIMEIISYKSNLGEISDAIKGAYGKHVDKDCKIVYFGQGIIGIGDKTILDKKVGISHYEWIELAEGVYFSIVK